MSSHGSFFPPLHYFKAAKLMLEPCYGRNRAGQQFFKNQSGRADCSTVALPKTHQFGSIENCPWREGEVGGGALEPDSSGFQPQPWANDLALVSLTRPALKFLVRIKRCRVIGKNNTQHGINAYRCLLFPLCALFCTKLESVGKIKLRIGTIKNFAGLRKFSSMQIV